MATSINKIGLLVVLSVVLLCAVFVSLGAVHAPQVLASSSQKTAEFPHMQSGTTAVDAAVAVDNVTEELVYLDGDGKIRVLDVTPGAHGELTWASPEGGFIDVASGDFNLDGDHEIVGIKNVDNRGHVIMYDPVLASTDVEPDGWFGDVAWRKLAEIQTARPLNFLETGELDTFFPGDEILYGMNLANNRSAIRIITADSQSPEGTSWRTHIDPDFDWRWDNVAVGNIDGEATDEVVLMGSQTVSNVNTSLLHFYRVNTPGLQSKAPFARQDRTSIRWLAAAVGEIKNLGPQEVVVIGESLNNSSDNIHVFNYTPSQSGGILDYVDGNDQEFVNPDPDAVFLADITGVVNNQRDFEMFFLRSVPASIRDAPRFFARNQGNDTTLNTSRFDLSLDSDNGWQGGTGADVDGDGKDEIVIIRNSAIRIYTEPDDGLEAENYALPTNGTDVIAANLDASGARAPRKFDVSVSGLENGLEVDTTGEFLIDLDSDGPIDFTASLISPPGWVKSLAPLSGQAPAEVSLTVDSTGLNPGRYTTNVRITTDDPFVQQSQFDVEIELNVLTNSFSVSPNKIFATYFPCERPFGISRTNIAVTSSTSVGYTAVVLGEASVAAAGVQLSGPITDAVLEGNILFLYDARGNRSQITLPEANEVFASKVDESEGTVRWRSAVPWIFARSQTGMTSESIEVFFDPEELVERGSTLGKATLLVLADEDVVSAPFNVRTIPLEFLCASTQVLLPIIIL